MKGKSPKIFFDASIKNNIIGIGIYEMHSKKTKQKAFNMDKKIEANEAEEMAFKEAIKWAKNEFYLECVLHFFTDNKSLYEKQHIQEHKDVKIELFWVPRELNKAADKLASIENNIVLEEHFNKHTKLKKSILEYISKNYSYNHKIKLLNEIAFSKREKKFIKNMNKINHALDSELIDFYSIVFSLLRKSERPKIFKKISSYPGFKTSIKNKNIETRLREIMAKQLNSKRKTKL